MKEEWICSRFCCKFGGKECDINFQTIEFGFWRAENGKNTIFKQFSKLKSGVTTVEDAQDVKSTSSSKTDENVDRVKELFFEVRKISILVVANRMGISFGSVQSIWKDKAMCCLGFTYVPCLLS